MDDPFSNKSWSVASRGLFTAKEIGEMELEMLKSLDWVVGERKLDEKLKGYERDFRDWEVLVKAEEDRRVEVESLKMVNGGKVENVKNRMVVC